MKITNEHMSPEWPQDFLHNLQQAINFHRQNQDDPHGVGNAAILCLCEVRDAFNKALIGQRLPNIKP